jgi:hypothetical protein
MQPSSHHPSGLVAPVEIMSDLPVPWLVLRQIGVQEDDGCPAPEMAFDRIEPAANPYGTVLDSHSHLRIQRVGPLGGVPVGGLLDLVALRVDALAEVTGPADQCYSDHGQAQIRGRSQSIAREHAETSGIGRNFTA